MKLSGSSTSVSKIAIDEAPCDAAVPLYVNTGKATKLWRKLDKKKSQTTNPVLIADLSKG